MLVDEILGAFTSVYRFETPSTTWGDALFNCMTLDIHDEGIILPWILQSIGIYHSGLIVITSDQW